MIHQVICFALYLWNLWFNAFVSAFSVLNPSS